jgi:hypothetical protein
MLRRITLNRRSTRSFMRPTRCNATTVFSKVADSGFSAMAATSARSASRAA